MSLLSTPNICTFHTPTCNMMQQNVGLTAVAIQQSFTKTPQNIHKSTTTYNPFYAGLRLWNEVFQKHTPFLENCGLHCDTRPVHLHQTGREYVGHKLIYRSLGPHASIPHTRGVYLNLKSQTDSLKTYLNLKSQTDSLKTFFSWKLLLTVNTTSPSLAHD